MLAAAEHASRQMAEEMLAVEAELADAAVESALDERAARLQAEAVTLATPISCGI